MGFARSICGGGCRVCLAIVNTAGYHYQNTLAYTFSRYESWRLSGGSDCCLYGVCGEVHGIVGLLFGLQAHAYDTPLFLCCMELQAIQIGRRSAFFKGNY